MDFVNKTFGITNDYKVFDDVKYFVTRFSSDSEKRPESFEYSNSETYILACRTPIFTETETKPPFPDKSMTFPNENLSFPNENLSFPNAKSSFPNAKSSFPNAKLLFPNAKSSFPNAKSSFPNAKSSFPNERTSFPNERISFPSGDLTKTLTEN
jgi:hypothetical protein